MAVYEFKLVYDDRRQVARLTNVPGADGYVCGYDIVFNSAKDKRDLKEGLTAIVLQLQKPLNLRGAEDRTPIEVKENLRRTEELEEELAQVKEELRLEKEKNQ